MQDPSTEGAVSIRRGRALALLLAALVTAGLIAGCSSKKEEVDTAATTTEAEDETPATTRERERTTTTRSGGSPGTAVGDDAEEEVTDSTWTENATNFRGRNGLKVAYECAPGGQFGSVWGTGTYTDDSSVCTAAVHAGLITQPQGGRVVIEIEPGEDSYDGSTSNGVTSSDYGRWDGSYTFVE